MSYQQGLAALVEERANVAKRLGLLDRAIEGVTLLVELDKAPATRQKAARVLSRQAGRQAGRQKAHRAEVRTPARSAVPDVADAGRSDVSGDTIASRVLAALEGGPQSTGQLVTRVKAAGPTLRRTLRQLSLDGKAHQQGTGPRNFRWVRGAKALSLGGSKPSSTKKDDTVGEVVWNGVSGRHVSLSSR